MSKPIIGILGGICSGKTSVSREFEKLGCGVICADTLAHETLNQESIKSLIKDTFGSDVFNKDNTVNKKALAGILFDNDENIQKINTIIHPPVLKKAESLIRIYKKSPAVKAIILDIPLLIESGWENRCKSLVFVECLDELRAQRARKKGLNFEKDVKKRENFQISLDKKAEISDYIIRNNSGLSELSEQVAEIFTRVINNK